MNTENTCDSCDSANTVITAGGAIQRSLPQCELTGDRDFSLAVFRLARHLKAVVTLKDRPIGELKPLVKQWHQEAVALLPGRTATDCWAEFASAWPAVRFAAGDDVVCLAWAIAQLQSPPPEAANYDDPRIGQLIALCRQIGRERGDGKLFLGGRRVAELFGTTQPVAAKWLKMLVVDGILEIEITGGNRRGGRRLAREYRCLGNQDS